MIILETIKQAGRQQKVLRIMYMEKDGAIDGWRYVEPYSFSHDDGEEDLFAWDRAKNGIRRFTLSRISQADITEESFPPRYPVEIT